MPCHSVKEGTEDMLLYCEEHDRLVCFTCHRHVVEDENSAEPGTALNCPVHGIVSRVGDP